MSVDESRTAVGKADEINGRDRRFAYDGVVELTDLQPGTYEVRVRVPRGWEVLTSPLEVELIAGETTAFGPVEIARTDR